MDLFISVLTVNPCALYRSIHSFSAAEGFSYAAGENEKSTVVLRLDIFSSISWDSESYFIEVTGTSDVVNLSLAVCIFVVMRMYCCLCWGIMRIAIV